MFVHSVVVLFSLSLSVFLTDVESANILVVEPLPAQSHFKCFQPLFEKLVERGHNLTIISGYPLSSRFESKYTHVNIRKYFDHAKIVFAEMRKQTRIGNMIFCTEILQDYTDILLETQEIQNMIHSGNKYDLILGHLFYLDAFLAFAYKFNAPLIGISAQSIIIYYSWLLGNPISPSYIPNFYLPMTEQMTFIERMINTGFDLISILYFEWISLPRSQKQIEKNFNFDKKNTPNIRDIIRNISLILANNHYSFGYPKPYSPNVIEIGGLHMLPRKPLPKNLQEFMDDASEGVIYVSLGSLIEPNNIKQTGDNFVKILSNLSQRVLFKWDSKLLSTIPENFLVQEWTPQTDVLSHPNCRLFITHGGLHSLLESVNSSVPVVGLPFFSDQQHNMALVEYYEIGLTLQTDEIESKLLNTVQEVLGNPKYKRNVKERARIFNERLASPLETAAHWVEYILKIKNPNHLTPASVRLRWYELLLFDVVAIYLAFVAFALYLIYRILLFLTIQYGKISRNSKVLNRLKDD